MEQSNPASSNVSDISIASKSPSSVTVDPAEFTPTSFRVVGKKEGAVEVANTISSKIEQATKLKNEGNEFFKSKEYKKALSSYNRALMYVTGLLGAGDENYQYGNKETKLSEGDNVIVKELKNSIFLNMSQIDLFAKNYSKCVERATKALAIKATAKGFYRRAIAFVELNEFDRAKSDFEQCVRLDPNTENDVHAQLINLKSKEKIADKKSSAFFAKMFK